jgi:hypothetical protein
VLDYARPIARQSSPLIEEAGDGYVVLRLPEPPWRIEVLRLVGLLLVIGMLVLAMAMARVPWLLRPSRSMQYIVVLGIVAIAFGVKAYEQAALLYRRLRLPPATEHAVRLSTRPEADNPPATLPVAAISIEVDESWLPLSGDRASVRLTTRNGQAVYLLAGHPPETLRAVVRDLKEALFPVKRRPTPTRGPA